MCDNREMMAKIRKTSPGRRLIEHLFVVIHNQRLDVPDSTTQCDALSTF
jgi:hypothetical protein